MSAPTGTTGRSGDNHSGHVGHVRERRNEAVSGRPGGSREPKILFNAPSLEPDPNRKEMSCHAALSTPNATPSRFVQSVTRSRSGSKNTQSSPDAPVSTSTSLSSFTVTPALRKYAPFKRSPLPVP